MKRSFRPRSTFITGATLADPNSIEAHSRLAGALVYFGDTEAASSSLNTALDLEEPTS